MEEHFTWAYETTVPAIFKYFSGVNQLINQLQFLTWLKKLRSPRERVQ